MRSFLSSTEFFHPLWQEIIINLLLAFALGLVCSWIYRWTHRGFSYSISFVHTIILLVPITTFVMMVIGNSIARAFSLVGALSIIRFRTPLKDTRDTAFVFLALGIGFATGTNAYAIATLGVLFIGIFAVLMHKIRLGESIKDDFLLRFRVNSSSNVEGIYKEIFGKYLKKNTLVNMTSAHLENFLELAYSISFKNSREQQSFVKELGDIQGLEQVMLVSVDEVEEY
ncbi:DUF4956 domain-containing protein [Candidatus Poribacteria bacterium]|nr:DUF4956 domain-containing protein [Candidatus Poribacteria bacterium]